MLITTLTWDLEGLAAELHIPVIDTLAYFQDGRKASFIIERRLAYEYLQGKIAESEGASYDVFDRDGKKWEVRCLTKRGMYFCPSYMKGKGRVFEESGFLDKLSEVEGYLIGKITDFPTVPIYQVDSSQVMKWWRRGDLGSSTQIQLNKAQTLFQA